MLDDLDNALRLFAIPDGCRSAASARRIEQGFSGAVVWRLPGSAQEWAVRRWPVGYRSDRLAWILRTLDGLPVGLPIPRPLRTRGGEWFATLAGSYWSIEPWMPGSADYWSHPSDGKLTSAMRVLAEFHSSVGRFAQPPATIPAVLERLAALNDYRESVPDLKRAIDRSSEPIRDVASALWAAALDQMEYWQQSLLSFAETESTLIPCIRDIWHDHVLYSDNQVSGMVDFGAMRFDSRAVDLARLVGSLVGDDHQRRRSAIDAYESAAALSSLERKLIDVLDGSSLLISGLNWTKWVCVDGRSFRDPEQVLARMRQLLSRLQRFRAVEH
jgi:Ser/Thr protein kinase RdoA (MazF antagonist)